MLNNHGDPLKALESLGNPDTIKNIALSMATAGVLKGIGDYYNLPTNADEVSKAIQKATETAKLLEPTLMQQIPEHLACQGAHFAANTSMGLLFKQRFETVIKSSGIAAIANTVGGVASNNIGAAFKANQIGTITHKLLHGIAGAISGGIMNGIDGVAAGAFGAIMGEVIAEALLPTHTPEQNVSETNEQGKAASQKTSQPTKRTNQNVDPERVRQVHAIARIVVATGAALIPGMDEHDIATASANSTGGSPPAGRAARPGRALTGSLAAACHWQPETASK